MNSIQTSRPLLFLLLGLLALAGGLFVVTQSGSGRDVPRPIGEREEPQLVSLPKQPDEQLLIPEPFLESRPLQAGPSTVLWPLQVELDLIDADFLPTEEGVVGVGSGASAELKGQITDRAGDAARATVRFVAGSNEGRVLSTNSDGFFGAANLYPGISIVEVMGPKIVGSRRELRLRQRSVQLLNIGYARPATVVGWVQDQEGKPILGARVRVDGIPLRCDLDGAFSATNVASGISVLLEIEHEDYVSLHSVVRLAAGQRTPEAQWKFTLRKGSDLRLVVSNDIGGPGPVDVYLLPGSSQRNLLGGTSYRKERYSFDSINPIKVNPGSSVRVRGLPSGSIAVHAFRVGAKTKMGFANLRPGQETVFKIRLASAEQIRGILTKEGKPVVGVDVRLEAPDRVRATLAYLRKSSGFLESSVMPTFPAAAQISRTNAKGEFSFTEWERESATRYIEARGAKDESIAGRLVHPGEREVNLELKPANLGQAMLSIKFPGRFQSLPVELSLNGQPFDPAPLAAADDLLVKGLLEGDWRLRVSWHGTEIYPAEELRIAGATERSIRLIPDCIEGQDEEDWLRAGREYPVLAE